ncbi:P-loop containing nucleoside triphosphate hydrolase protein [Blastocladiella britannica]|nr:P-loop containing nucleoside triphosphate hydrolase protein [Blastocladiella britannica]
MSIPLATLGLPPRLQNKLLNGGYLWSGDILGSSAPELAHDLSIGVKAASDILGSVAAIESASVYFESGLAVLEQWHSPLARLPFGSFGLDHLLEGGVPRGSVTELTGPPGAGTTTLTANLVIATLAGNLAARVLVLDTDGPLTELLQQQLSTSQIPHWASRVTVHAIPDLHTLVQLLSHFGDGNSARTHVPDLVVIDRLSAHLDHTDKLVRARAAGQLGALLRELVSSAPDRPAIVVTSTLATHGAPVAASTSSGGAGVPRFRTVVGAEPWHSLAAVRVLVQRVAPSSGNAVVIRGVLLKGMGAVVAGTAVSISPVAES